MKIPKKLHFYFNVFLLVFVASLVFYLNFNFKQFDQAKEMVLHTDQTNQELTNLLTYLNNAETGVRGYLVIPQLEFLEPYFKSKDLVDPCIDNIKKIISDNPNQIIRIDDVRQEANEELGILNKLVHINKNDKTSNLDSLIKQGKFKMDNIRVLLKKMSDEENELLTSRLKVLAKTNENLILSLNLTSIFIVLLAIFIFIETKKSSKLAQLNQLEQKRQSEILNLVHDAIFSRDQDNIITDWNNGSTKLFGYTSTQAIGKNINELLKPVYKTDLSGILNDFNKTGFWEGEIAYTNKNNELITCSSRWVKRIDPDKRQSEIIESNNDITSLVNTSKELSEKYDNIKRLNFELAQANEEIQESSRLKTQFVANMSHEIRTPMNGIIGMCNALMSTKLDSRQLDYTRLIKEASNSLLTIINDILDFSKIEANKLELELIEFNVESVIENVCDLLANQAQKKNLSLLSYVDTKLSSKYIGDPDRIRQILINLTSNAIKFSTSGEIVVSAQLHSSHKDTTEILFSVEDNGIGLKDVDFEAIIKPFTQADGSISRRFGGTGLGLSICKKLVDLMNGQIGFDKDRQKGSKFWFILPLPNTSAQVLTNTYAELKNLRILIVDDEPRAREILHSYVISFGLRNGMASSAAEALELINQGLKTNDEVNIVLVDLLMTDTNGLELAKIILDNPTTSHLKLVLVTAHDSPGFAKQALEHGFSACLTKPIKKSQLLNCLLEIVHSSTANPEIAFKDNFKDAKLDLSPDTTVLIVEDHQINQQVTQIYLQELGITSHIANNGKEAIEEYTKHNYSLILMDCQMPEMDGFTTTKLIRSMESKTNTHIPIIAMTAHAMKGDREKCLSSGMDDYLSKPVNPKEFRQKLTKWLLSNPKKSSNNRLIDLDKLKEKYRKDDLRNLFDLFRKDGLNLIINLKQSLIDQDKDQIMQLTHGLKGIAATLELQQLSHLLHEIDNKLKHPKLNWNLIDNLIKSTELQYALVCESVDENFVGSANDSSN